jgi:hypothetical protein
MIPERNNKILQSQAEGGRERVDWKRKVWTVRVTVEPPKKNTAGGYIHRFKKKWTKTIAPNLNESVDPYMIVREAQERGEGGSASERKE